MTTGAPRAPQWHNNLVDRHFSAPARRRLTRSSRPRSSPTELDLKRRLAQLTHTAPDDWFLTFKARYAMLVAFRNLAKLSGPGPVTTQAFTCATAIDPVIVAGLTPDYQEISPASIALDASTLSPAADTRAIVLQHTFGIIDPRNSAALRQIATQNGALLLEDSAHCIGRMARDDDGAPLADISIHSFGVEKMTPTSFGGATWVNPALNPELRRAIVADFNSLPEPGLGLRFATRIYRTLIRILNRLPRPIASPLRHALIAAKLLEPAIAPVELAGGLASPPLGMGKWVARRASAALSGDLFTQRAAATAAYLQEFSSHPEIQVPGAITSDMPLLRFPIFLASNETAERVIKKVKKAGFYATDWYRPALYPGIDDDAAYHLDIAKLPITTGLIDRVANLPTNVDPETARIIANIVINAATSRDS